MRPLALALVASLLLAGCLSRPEGSGGSAVATPEGSSDAAPVATPEGLAAPGRAAADELLPLALRWARAWEEDAELVGFTSALGKDGVPELGRVAQPLDGQDGLWAFRFSSPATRGVLVVQLRADGEVHDMYATGSPEPSRPVDSLGIGTREARWLVVARTSKVVDALEGKAETRAWAGVDVDSVSYEMVLREGGKAQLQVTAWRGATYFAALIDADSWTVIAGGEVPPQVGSTASALSSSMPRQ